MEEKNNRVLKNILAPGSNLEDRFIPDYGELQEVVEQCKKMGYKIVLTQGVYDLVHEGHALYLEKARSHGDLLIVGVDTDELTRERKGQNRPVVPQEERRQMLVNLRHVDIVTLRDVEHGIEALIKLVCPDVLITSETTKDFPQKDIDVYEPYCGEIITLPLQATTSTTARIRLLSINGADRLADDLMKGIPKLVKRALAGIKNGQS